MIKFNDTCSPPDPIEYPDYSECEEMECRYFDGLTCDLDRNPDECDYEESK